MSQFSSKIAVATLAYTASLALAACTFEVESRERAQVEAPSEPLKPSAAPQSACLLGKGPLARVASYETRFAGASAVASARGAFAIAAEHELGVLSFDPAGPRLDAVVSEPGDAVTTAGVPPAIALAANGSRLAFGNGNGAVTVWDVAQRTIVARLEALTQGMATLALSDDGALVAVGDPSGAVRLWTPDTGEIVRAPQNLQAKALIFMPAQTDLLVAGRTLSGWSSIEVLERWSHASGFSQTGQCNVQSLEAVAVTPSGAELVAIGASGLTRFDAAAMTPNLGAPADAWHDPQVLAMSPDGALFATLGSEGTLRLFETATMSEVARADVALQIGLVFDAAGERIASVGRDGMLHVFGCMR